MIVVDSFRGRPVGVLGLAKSGRAAIDALAAGGAKVLAWDDNAKVREALATELPLYDLTAADWRNIPALVLSPGIPHSFPEPHPAVLRAREAGAEIVGDLELLGRAQPDARYVGITGTNGKSTTTALIGHILASAGRPVEVGGNLGAAAPRGSCRSPCCSRFPAGFTSIKAGSSTRWRARRAASSSSGSPSGCPARTTGRTPALPMPPPAPAASIAPLRRPRSAPSRA